MTTVLALAAGVVTVAATGCDESNPATPTPVCAFALSSHEQAFASAGGPGTVSVETAAQCSWSVEGATGWVHLESPISVTGPGTVSFTVLPNTALDGRTKSLSIAGTMFTLTQAGQTPCAFSITPEGAAFGDEGGSGQVQVTAGQGCTWSVTSHVEWITAIGSVQGTGPGTVTYSVRANNASASRSGTLSIAGRTFAVTQAGESTPEPTNCEYSVSPVTFTPCMAGGRLTASLSTQADCPWTVSTSAGWLTLPNGRSGKGPGTISIGYADNYDAPREGLVMVRWPTPTAGQNVRIDQAGCLYSVSRSAFTFTSAAASGSFEVYQQSLPNSCGGPRQDQCLWTARSNVSWITVTTSMPRRGDNPVSFTVAANTGPTSRTGRVAVKDKVVTIVQAAP